MLLSRPVPVPPFLRLAIPVQLLVAFFTAQLVLTSTDKEELGEPSLSLNGDIYPMHLLPSPSPETKPRASA